MIDKALRDKSFNEAIKIVAKNNEISQKRVRELIDPDNRNESRKTIAYAVQNWTVELYNREMQKRSIDY